jgi:hypothetical protein
LNIFCSIFDDLDLLLITSKDNHDLELEVIGEDWKELWHLHKCILACRSPFFDGMIRNFSKFGKGNEEGYQHKTKFPQSTFQNFIRFLYSGKTLQFTVIDCLYLLAEADFYLDSPRLIDFCVDSIDKKMSASNCNEIYKVATDLNLDSIATTAKNFVSVPKKLDATRQKKKNQI